MGIMQQKMETTVQCLGFRVEGLWWENEMEKKMEAMETPLGLIVMSKNMGVWSIRSGVYGHEVIDCLPVSAEPILLASSSMHLQRESNSKDP